jgi:hypothetical protein
MRKKESVQSIGFNAQKLVELLPSFFVDIISLLSKLGFEFTLFCHPELVSGSQTALSCEMLNQY